MIAEARRLGFRAVVSDGAPDAPGFRLADAGLLARTADVEATLEAARAYAARTPIDGVLGVGGGASLAAAVVADGLGLPGVPPSTAALVVDQLALRERLGALGVAVPWCAPVPSAAALERRAAESERPLRVRPVDGGAVLSLVRGLDPGWAFELAVAASPTGRVMVEEDLGGPRLEIAALVVGGRTMTITCAEVADDPAGRFAPFVVGRGTTLPPRLHPALREKVEGVVASAVAALSLRTGPVTCELAIGARVPVLTALAVGLPGGHACTHDIPLATGVDIVEAAIRLALGETPAPATLAPRWSQAVARRHLFAPAGIVIGVQGALEAAAGEGIALVEVHATLGQRLTHAQSSGVVIAVGPTREIAIMRAEAAAARVRTITASTVAAESTVLH